MSYVTTATVNPKSGTLKPNQGILDFRPGLFCLWVQYKDANGNVDRLVISTFNPASSESFDQAIASAEQRCAELGISLLVEDPIAEHAKGHAIAQFFHELPQSGYDYDIYLARYQNECRDQDNVYKPTEEYELVRVDDLCLKIEAEYESLMAFSATHQLVTSSIPERLYIVCEYDEWRSASSRIIRGIFSSPDKATFALTLLYGEVQADPDGGQSGYKPTNNPNQVSLNILAASLNEVAEI